MLTMSLPFFACSAVFTGGNDDGSLRDSGTPTDSGTPVDTASGGALTVAGWVLDAHGLPYAGARVHNGATYVEADDEGRFSIGADQGSTLSAYGPAGGGTSCTRVFGPATKAVLAVPPRSGGTSIDFATGGSVTHGKAALTVPPLALGSVGLGLASLHVVDVATLGMNAAPGAVVGADGTITTLYAAAEVALEGVDGEIVPTLPLTVKLPLAVDNPGGAATVFVASDCGWSSVGTATISASGTDSVATFEVSAAGSYAVGIQDDGGCVTGQVVDGDGSPVSGATVRTYLQPVALGTASWLADTETASDGRFYLPASSLGVSILAEHQAGDVVEMGSGAGYGQGSTRDLTDCADVGNVVLAPAGCVLGNLYALDGSRPGPTPFRYQEGDPVWSTTEAEISFWARANADFTLYGPGGSEKTFTASSGTTPAADNCARLGNLQLPSQCVVVSATDAAGAGLEGVLVEGGVFDVLTSADGSVCVESPEGSVTFAATRHAGAQRLQASSAQSIDATGGTCYGGTCVEGPSLRFGGAGCASGVVYDENGDPAEGVRVVSSSWSEATTEADGTFTVATGGSGTGAAWAEGYPIATFDDPGADGTCADVTLFMDAGTPPDVIIGDDETMWYLSGNGDEETILEVDRGWQSDITTMDACPDENVQVSIHYGTLSFTSDLDGDDFDSFVSGLWSSARVSPDGSMVALQGYGAANPYVSLYDLDGVKIRDLSSSAGTTADGLAWSADSAWVASTRKDNAIEVTPASAARSPTTIATSDCAYPVFWDTDTVALTCTGAIRLASTDGSGSLSWLDVAGVEDRVWAVTSGNRVFYTSGEELHVAYIDQSDDTLLHVGNPGTTFSSVRVDDSERWVVAIVDDPVDGVDVVTFVDQPPYVAYWLTATPSSVELVVDFAE